MSINAFLRNAVVVAALLAAGCQAPIDSTQAHREANLAATTALLQRLAVERASADWGAALLVASFRGDPAEADRTLLKMLELD